MPQSGRVHVLEKNLSTELEIRQFREGNFTGRKDYVAVEVPLEIRLNGQPVATLMSLPSGRRYLGWGFLFCEGLIDSRGDVRNSYTGRNVFSISTVNTRVKKNSQTRLSGCGGGITYRNLRDLDESYDLTMDFSHVYSANRILSRVRDFLKLDSLFSLTGGVHSAALGSEDAILYHFEDIGRHNAVQKVIGKAFLNDEDVSDKMMLVTGRISAEMILDCARAGIPVVVSRSAPTSMAVDYAFRLGISVLGFARGRRANLYSFPGRITV